MIAPGSAEGYADAPRPPAVVFEEVSKFYGEVLGVNRVTLNIPRESRVWSGRTAPARRR